MCNGLEDYIEINESVVGKIPVSEWPTVFCFTVRISILGGSFTFLKLQSKWIMSTFMDYFTIKITLFGQGSRGYQWYCYIR